MKLKETILGHIKAIAKQLEELDEVESSDTASPLEPADLRARALAGKTMYYEYETPNGALSGCVKTFHSQTTCDNLLRKRAVFIDGDKAYREKVKEETPLQLRVGGRYLSREGEEVRIVGEDDHPDLPFDGDDGRCYSSSGRFIHANESKYDLIKEI